MELGCFCLSSQTFEKQERKKRSRALLGSLSECNTVTRRLYGLALTENSAVCENFFKPYVQQTSSTHLKERQTVPEWKVQRDFRRLHWKQRKREKGKVIYIQPIGLFPSHILKPLSGFSDKQDITVFGLLRNFVEVYFTGKRVTVLDEVNLDDMSCRTRIHKTTGKRQVLVGDILKYLKSCQPSDGYCTIGITWQDLYPSEDWNFVLGEASCEDGCAALSFGHYEPLSFMSTEISDNEEKNTSLSIHNQTVVEQGTQNDADESHKLNSFSGARPSNNQCLSGGLAEKLVDTEVDNGSIEDVNANVIWRLFRGVSHELGHVFGLTHCTFFSCAMNESSSITEAESQPLVVCPVCLRKLQLALGFEVQSRYDKLKAFLETVCAGLTELHIPSECQETVICKKESKFVETIKWLGNIDKCLAQEECTIEY